MKPNRAVSILLLTLVLSMAFVVLIPTLALAGETEKQKAETLLRILVSNNMSVLAAFSNLETQNVTVPSVAEMNYDEGLIHATEAVNLMSTDNFSEASIEAVEAMQLFKEALILLQNALQTEPTDTQVAAENITRLKASLTQGFKYIERLENLSANAKTAGYDTYTLDAKILETKNHLQNASDELDELNLEDALKELKAAELLRAEFATILDRLTQAVKVANAETYLQEAENRIAETKDNILSSTDLTTQVRDEAIAALNTSESYLDGARESLANSNPDEAISELEEARKWEDESRKVIVSATAVNSFESVNEALKLAG